MNIDFSRPDFDDPFLVSHLITYLGNKRRLLPFLYDTFFEIKEKLGKDKLVVLDGFVGSGSTARLLKTISSELHVNDIENYAETVNKAFLTNKSGLDLQKLSEYIDWLNTHKLDNKTSIGFIEQNYAPKDDNDIKDGERVFYTNTNAKIIDNIRKLIEEIPEPYKIICLASLLVKASVHNNTSGVFKGFHKKDGIGHFGGQGENAIQRIKQEIALDVPIFSNSECVVKVHKKDINELITDTDLPLFDLVYYDPPYNQHPYGSNYFMLNIINDGRPVEIQEDGVSGIAKNWNKSSYNKKKIAEQALDDLIKNTRSKFIVISYNDEGIIPIETFKSILSRYGSWKMVEQEYNTYRGSRNLKDRKTTVKELLWVIEKNTP